MQIEKIVINYIVKNPSTINAVKPNYFTDSEVAGKVFSIMKEMENTYLEIPSKEQILDIIRIKDEDEYQEYKGIINEIFDFDYDKYERNWIEEKFTSWVKLKDFEDRMGRAVDYYNKNGNIKNINEVIYKVAEIMEESPSIDLEYDDGIDFFDDRNYEESKQDEVFSTGYPFLDDVFEGGYRAGTLHCFAGQAKIGKSIFLGNLATKSMLSGNNTAVITLELSEMLYLQRLASNVLKIPREKWREKKVNSAYVRDRFSNLPLVNNFVPTGQLRIKNFGTASATVKDVERWLLESQKRNKFEYKVVVIDYINILSNYRNPNSENTYLKVTQIAQDLRSMAKRNKWTIVTATQFNRSGYDNTDVTFKDISESAGLVNTVDSLFGIIQTPEMNQQNFYELKVMANRIGARKNEFKRYDVEYPYYKIIESSEHSEIR